MIKVEDNFPESAVTSINADSVDSLVVQGINHIKAFGKLAKTRSGDCIQAHNVNYILKNPLNRVHSLRAPVSVQYLSREFLLYFQGTLSAEDFAHASRVWLKIQNNNGTINSNYGYYVFHVPTPHHRSQYDWVIDLLKQSKDTRRAIININNVEHKTNTLDMPCAVALHFYIQNNYVCCAVTTRSLDVVTGLPYDSAFFSFLLELVWKNLLELGVIDIKLGYCIIKTTFTQIYNNTAKLAASVLDNHQIGRVPVLMPEITSAQEIIDDIYAGTDKSLFMQWLRNNS